MFRVTLLLADSAQVADGKLYILGGAWRLTGPAPTPFALVAVVEIPAAEANRKIPIELFLVEASGRPVVAPGGTDIKIAGDVEVGPGGELPEGEPLTASVVLNLPGLPLVPGRSYEWRVKLDGNEYPDSGLRFTVRPAD